MYSLGVELQSVPIIVAKKVYNPRTFQDFTPGLAGSAPEQG